MLGSTVVVFTECRAGVAAPGAGPSSRLPRDRRHQIRLRAPVQRGGRKPLFVTVQKENNWHGDS